ncbi:uncharacterized protein LOC142356401 [Convolutriloba macropyga]|uniref:uncharacterized protein LOC142356401 n=1 Tax=Convolutriloba macropyga TaxID=536237 RepID=UPI003F52578D
MCGCVSLFISHPRWGPAMVQLRTNNYRRIEPRQVSQRLDKKPTAAQNGASKPLITINNNNDVNNTGANQNNLNANKQTIKGANKATHSPQPGGGRNGGNNRQQPQLRVAKTCLVATFVRSVLWLPYIIHLLRIGFMEAFDLVKDGEVSTICLT